VEVVEAYVLVGVEHVVVQLRERLELREHLGREERG